MLKKLKRENPYALLEKRAAEIATTLTKKARSRGIEDFHVQSFASLFWMIHGQVNTPDGVVRAIAEIPSTHKERYASSFHQLLQAGYYLAPSGFEVSFLSTAHTEQELADFIAAVEKTWQR